MARVTDLHENRIEFGHGGDGVHSLDLVVELDLTLHKFGRLVGEFHAHGLSGGGAGFVAEDRAEENKRRARANN